jgi:hypothetical protein
MKQQLTITVPKDWSAVTLQQFLHLKKDMETYKDEPEALVACLFHHLCKFPVEYLQQLDLDTYIAIKKDIYDFFNKVELPLKRFIEIDGVEYGFEPNLSQMAYGAYLDISKYQSLEMDEKWAEIMSILYRPVVKKQGALYDIKVYDGTIDKEKFLNVGMDAHWGAIFFFKGLLADLQSYILNSLRKESAEIPANIKSILLKSGNPIHPLSNWQMETLLK